MTNTSGLWSWFEFEKTGYGNSKSYQKNTRHKKSTLSRNYPLLLSLFLLSFRTYASKRNQNTMLNKPFRILIVFNAHQRFINLRQGCIQSVEVLNP